MRDQLLVEPERAARGASAPTPGDVALDGAVSHLLSQQNPRGCWEGEMVWNTMILAQVIIVRHLAGRPVEPAEREKMIRYFRVMRTPEGGWGLHRESGPYVFFTTMAYVALRLLGLPPGDPLLAPARDWLRAQPGGVLTIPTWGKFWLSVLGLYGWEGVNPLPPELYVLPEALPFHPNRFYCHTRYIYLAMAYLYGRRFTADLGPIGRELREELYEARDDAIDFAAHRHRIAPTDLYVPPTTGLRLAYEALRLYERAAPAPLRRRALGRCLERIRREQRLSRYLGLSPVNGLLNCLALLAHDPADPDLARSLDALDGWRWEDESEGIRYVGARSHTWDTAFALQALLASPRVARAARGEIARAYRHLAATQLVDELEEGAEERRDPVRGGWCFSDGAHRWPVSDCTAEALSAILEIHARSEVAPPPGERIPLDRLVAAAEFVLSRQNDDGGFGTYERRRGAAFLERVNPSEMYGSCMTERSYVECTSSSLAALARFRAVHPSLLRPRIDRAIDGAVRLLRDAQRSDGSWPGFWGVNFTYAIWHAVRALRTAGVPPDDPALARAAAWLARTQRPDGGWGEHWRGCLDDRYVEHPSSQVVMTSWALLALLEITGPRTPTVARGLAFLRARQRPDGSWPEEAVNGVFFGSAMLDYRLYRSYFPTWALARARALIDDEEEVSP